MKAITRRCAALIVGISLCVSASAAPAEAQDEARIQACLVQAAAAFQVEVLPLKLLRQVEAGTLGRVSGNTNGSYDIGPMQINSTWLPRLARVGITEEMVRDDCPSHGPG